MPGHRWQRLEALFDIDAASGAHVLVAGLGSGGSTVAVELAKAGVGRFTLIDPDTIEEVNLVRHECDDRFLGRNKAEAVAELIAHRNPDAVVEALGSDVFDLGERLEALVGEADLVAVCIDAEPPKHLLNQMCTEASTPAVYAGVYARAAGGEVIRCLGGVDDPCYACVMSVLKGSAPTPVEAEELDYGTVDADGGIRGVPGLGIDVRFIALIHAKVCLTTLLEARTRSADAEGSALAPPPADVILFGNEQMEGLFPRAYASAFVQVARQRDCMVCGPLRVSMEPEAGTA